MLPVIYSEPIEVPLRYFLLQGRCQKIQNKIVEFIYKYLGYFHEITHCLETQINIAYDCGQ